MIFDRTQDVTVTDNYEILQQLMELYTYLVNSISNLEYEGIQKWVKPFK